MIEWAMYINGLDMDISHKASGLFLCPFKISFEYLIIFISFLSKMGMQSLSQSWPKEISETLCIPLKMRSFFEWMLRLPDNMILPVLSLS